MKQSLTAKQQAVLSYVRDYIAANGKSPTLQELADAFQVECTTVLYHVRVLQKKGRLSRYSCRRGIMLADPTPVCSRENCFRKVKVNLTIDARQTGPDRTMIIPEELSEYCSPSEVIAWEIPDDSMFGLGVHCGDVVLCVPVKYKEPRQGDLVLAELPELGTVVRSYRPLTVGQAEFIPAQEQFVVKKYFLKKVRMLGVVVALHRDF